MLLTVFVACNEKEKYFDEPIDVPFTVFSISENCSRSSPIPEALCGFRVSDSKYKITIINSDSELRHHIVCLEGSSFPTIDFSKYTLLLARGTAHSSGSFPRSIDLQQYSSRNYVINVHVDMGWLAMISYWHVAIITDKLSENVRVRLNVTN